MAPKVFENQGGSFTLKQDTGLEAYKGWWFEISEGDLDQDGDPDYVLGNLGLNNKFKPNPDKPLFIYARDFDQNGSFDVALAKINEGKEVPIRGKECSSEQNPFLLEKIGTYSEFANLDMNGIYGSDNLNAATKYEVTGFASAYIENLGNGKFKLKELPMGAQQGPTLSIQIQDVNADGNLDIVGVGAIYDAEVETIRYDANFGYVLLGNGDGSFSCSDSYDGFTQGDAYKIVSMQYMGRSHYIIGVNDNPPLLATFD